VILFEERMALLGNQRKVLSMAEAQFNAKPLPIGIDDKIGNADWDTVLLIWSKMDCIDTLEDFEHYLDNPKELETLSPLLKKVREKLIQSATLKFGKLPSDISERVGKANEDIIILFLSKIGNINTLEDFAHYLDNPV
jgi:hypothetical protein